MTKEEAYAMQDNNRDNQPVTPPTMPPVVIPPEPTAEERSTMTPGGGRFKSKKVLLLVLGIIVVVAIGASLLWYFVLAENGKTADTTDNQNPDTSEQSTETVAFSQPDRLIYYRSNETERTLYTRSITSDDEVKALTLPSGVFISDPAIYNNRTAFTTSYNYDSGEKGAVYYSNDSGKSYKKIYTVATAEAQITSLVFSTDGKALAIGVLPEMNGKNQVTEIDPESNNAVKTLFTVDKPGVFLEAYDRSKQKAIYFSGCYNCDGYHMQDMYMYDIAANKEDLLHHTDDDTLLLGNVTVTNDLTKVLALAGQRGEQVFSTKAPYDLFTIDIATKSIDNIKTFDDGEALFHAGYTLEGDPYITTRTRVRKVADDGVLTTLFEATSDNITNPLVLFAGNSGVIAQVTTSAQDDGSSAPPTFAIMYMEPGNASPMKVMEQGSDIGLIGVTRK